MAAVSLPLVRRTQRRLQTQRLGRPMEGHASLGSTNTRASQWAADGAAEGSTVIAEQQTAGRGRHGRRWTARAGQNLTFSVVLRPGDAHADRDALPPARFGLLALAAGVAVCEVVAEAVAEAVAPPAPSLKWPNDVLLNGRKCCGILLESSTGTRPGPVIVGVGLNVNQDDFSSVPGDGLAATSLLLETGRSLDRAPLLATLLERLEARYLSLFVDGGASVRDTCERRLSQRGRRVTLRLPGSGERLEGTARGLAADGALRLETAAGERTVHAGEVTTR